LKEHRSHPIDHQLTRRTLLRHGGALAPDSIPPALGPGNLPGEYDLYGPRVPAIVASPYSKPNAVTNAVHDHTSFPATVEAKWNLPRLTYRDANARTVMDFLNPETAAFPEPPTTIIEPPAPVQAATTP
jgi:phospholipase C